MVDPVQEDELVERSGKRTHQVQIVTGTRQVLLARQKLTPGKLRSDT